MPFSTIHSVATAFPPFKVTQHDVRDLVYSLFSEQYRGLEKLIPVFDNTQIKTRHFSKPLDWFKHQADFVESSKAFVETAQVLLLEASEKAISQAQIKREDIAMVVAVSTTGITTPSLDAKLLQSLKLHHNTKRVPIWGLGCAGGVAGMARAAELTQSLDQGKYLLLAGVELCSLTFQRNDISKSNIIASSLFADGAAAVILGKDDIAQSNVKVVNSFSHIFDDSEDIMGWDIVQTGLKVRFSRDIPTLISQNLPQILDAACADWKIERKQIRHFVVHAGGAKVLQAYVQSLQIPAQQLDFAFDVLENHGNMSSVSVLFALERFLAKTEPSDDYGVMIALGPGFSAEFVLFQF